MSRILLQRLASGVGARDQRWVEEWRSAFWEIVRKASTVDKAARTDVTFNERDEMQWSDHGSGSSAKSFVHTWASAVPSCVW
jgi:hypothetical protein